MHLVIVLAIAAILLASGCVRDKGNLAAPGPAGDQEPGPGDQKAGPGEGEQTAPDDGGNDEPDEADFSCSGLGGFECDVGEECQGEWLDATDSFSCCSQACEPVADNEDILTIDPFETNPENEDLGDLT